MGTSERRVREREELRRKIIETTGDLIAEEGHEKLTIRKLAGRIEYSPRTVYLYFKDKETLLRAVVEEGFKRTVGIREKDGAEAHQPEDTLALRIRSHIASAFSRPNLYRAIVTLIMERNFEPGESQKRVIAQTRHEIEAMLPDKRRTEEEISNLTSILFTTTRAVTLSLLNAGEQYSPEERERFITGFIRFLKDGINPEHAPAAAPGKQ